MIKDVLKKTLSISVGYGALVRTTRAFRRLLWNDAAQWGYDTTVEAVKHLSGKTRRRLETESFDDAVKRFGLTARDLEARRVGLIDQAIIFRWLGYASMAATLASGYFTDGIWWFVLIILNGLSISVMFFAFAFVRSFRAWQIDIRELAPIRKFLNDGGLIKTLLG